MSLEQETLQIMIMFATKDKLNVLNIRNDTVLRITEAPDFFLRNFSPALTSAPSSIRLKPD